MLKFKICSKHYHKGVWLPDKNTLIFLSFGMCIWAEKLNLVQL